MIIQCITTKGNAIPATIASSIMVAKVHLKAKSAALAFSCTLIVMRFERKASTIK